MKFGYELEFACPSSIKYLDLTNCALPEFYLIEDCSACHGLTNFRGCELVSKIFSDFPMELFGEQIKILKSLEARITKTCGFHIHFSGFDLESDDLLKLGDYLKTLNSWRSRDPWINDENSSGRYRHLNIVSCTPEDKYHCEVRVFNASFNVRALFQYHKTLMRCIEKLITDKSS